MVDVVVAHEQDVHPAVVHEPPHVEVHLVLRATVGARVVRVDELLPLPPVERRMMLERQGACGLFVGGKIVREPLVLRRTRTAARVVAADVGVQRHDVPGAQVGGVVPLGPVRPVTEVVEVPLRALGAVLVVPGRGERDRIQMSELLVVDLQELRELPVVVLDIPQREERIGIEVRDQFRHLVRTTGSLTVALAERLARDVPDRRDHRIGRRRCGGACRDGPDQCSATDQHDDEGDDHAAVGTDGHAQLLRAGTSRSEAPASGLGQ